MPDEIRYAVPVAPPRRRYNWLLLIGGFVAGAVCLLAVLPTRTPPPAPAPVAVKSPIAILEESGFILRHKLVADGVEVEPGRYFYTVDAATQRDALHACWSSTLPAARTVAEHKLYVVRPNGTRVEYGWADWAGK